MRRKIIVYFIFVLCLITGQLYGVYHKIAEKNLYYFTSCISMKDDILFIGTDELYSNPLFVINAEDPYNPNIIGEYSGFGGIREVCVYDTVIFIAHDRSNLTIGNITDPDNVAMTERCSGITFNSIDTKNEFAFAGTDIGLIVLDITLPSEPAIIDTLSMPEIERITLNQNNVYALTDEGLYIIDISDPSNSVIEGMYQVDLLLPTGIAYNDNYVYITARNHILVFDISDSQNPEFVYDKCHYGFPNDLYVKDSILYTCGSLYGFGAFDISNPPEIKLMNNYVAPREAVASCMDDDYVYIADWGYGLEIIKRDDTLNPYLIQHYFSDDLIINCFINKYPYLYFSEYARGVGIYDRNDPTGTPLFPVDSIYGGELVFDDSYLYMNYSFYDKDLNYGLLVYDCEDPLQPELVADFPYRMALFKIHNSYLYNWAIDRIRVYEVSDSLALNYLGYALIGGASNISDYGVTDSVIWACSYMSPRGLFAFNNFESGYPEQLSFREFRQEIFEFEIYGDIALAAYYNQSWYGSDTGFYVIDISNPYDPEFIDHIIVHEDDSKIGFTDFGSIFFAKNNNTLVVADNSNNRLISYDCTDFSNLQIKDEFWWNFKTTEMTFNGSELITCNFGNGITVLDWSDFLDVDEPQEPVIENNLLVFPNPISTSTNISFNITKAGRIQIALYNIKGQKIEEISDSYFLPGEHTIEWGAKSSLEKRYPSGVYFIGFEKDGYLEQAQKVIILK